MGAFDRGAAGGVAIGGGACVFLKLKKGETLFPFCKRRAVLFAINRTGIAIYKRSFLPISFNLGAPNFRAPRK